MNSIIIIIIIMMLNDKVGHEDEDNSWMLTVHTFFY